MPDATRYKQNIIPILSTTKSPATMSSDDSEALSHLYSSSFNLHKLTPLSCNGSLTSNLRHYSTRLTNTLRGDVLRGVRVAGASQTEDSASRTGNLQNVDFDAIDISAPGSGSDLKAVAIVFKYDKITYSAYLVQNASDEPSATNSATSSRQTSSRRASLRTQQSSSYYPLLLTRLPAWLQARFIGFMSENFDCHISNLRIPDGFIMKSIESYLEYFAPEHDILVDNRPNKSLQLWLEPPPIKMEDSQGEDKEVKLQTLKSLAMTFTRDDIPGLIYKGQQLKEKQEDEGLQDNRGPFELALSLYAYHHMGMFIEKLKIGKAACGEFVIGVSADGSGKCKFFPPRFGSGDLEQSSRDLQQKSWDKMLESLVELAS